MEAEVDRETDTIFTETKTNRPSGEPTETALEIVRAAPQTHSASDFEADSTKSTRTTDGNRTRPNSTEEEP